MTTPIDIDTLITTAPDIHNGLGDRTFVKDSLPVLGVTLLRIPIVRL